MILLSTVAASVVISGIIAINSLSKKIDGLNKRIDSIAESYEHIQVDSSLYKLNMEKVFELLEENNVDCDDGK